ncbi:TRAP transporter substrate-binding protein [Aquibium microcysteis]|uniref:TRAP transporter substrate-binding protein n=1 Tax=Aquibium microcysteis TaxID=675281 RepID=UPI00165D2714|nr:TRAP transporter substrate-binding protein [Aquibium microcysteis]
MNIRSGLLAALVLLAPGAAFAQDVTLKFGHAAASSHLFQNGLVMFADKVAEKTGGKVKIEVFGDRQLGDDKQLLEGIQLGTIDGALVSVPTIPLTLNAPAFDALQLPFLVPSYDKMAEVLSSDVGQQMLDSLGTTGIKGLGYIEAGQRHFLSRTKAVKSVADFAGLKTRIVPTPLHKAIWEAVGTNPIGMAYGEIFSALETGTIDAVEINLSSAYAESFYEAAKNATLTGHYFWPGVLMMGGPKFDSLPDDVKTAIVAAGHEVIAEHYALARDQEAEIARKLEEKGVTISKLDDLEEMQARMKPVFDSWLAKDPLIQSFVDAVRQSN